MEPENPQPRVSMREIAARVGVSHVTVSMALRDNPRVSAAMREKIKKVAEEMGYRPDPMLNALAAYRNSKSVPGIHSAVAWINAWERPDELRGFKEFDLYWKGASECAAKFGYRLEEFRLDVQMTSQRLHQIFQARNIRGVLLPPHGSYKPAWEDFPWEEYTVARFGRSLKHPDSHLVTADQVANTVLAVKAMSERGYQRIGYVADIPYDREHGMLFSAGYLYAQSELPEGGQVPVFDIGGVAVKDLGKKLVAWIKEHRVDAIFTNRGEVMALLAKQGVKVPDDVAVAVTSVLDAHADAGIDQHPEEIGRVAFLMLNSLINDGARGIPKIFRQILVEGSWVDGKSLPDRRSGD